MATAQTVGLRRGEGRKDRNGRGWTAVMGERAGRPPSEGKIPPSTDCRLANKTAYSVTARPHLL
jgi:hypothetical protein